MRADTDRDFLELPRRFGFLLLLVTASLVRNEVVLTLTLAPMLLSLLWSGKVLLWLDVSHSSLSKLTLRLWRELSETAFFFFFFFSFFSREDSDDDLLLPFLLEGLLEKDRVGGLLNSDDFRYDLLEADRVRGLLVRRSLAMLLFRSALTRAICSGRGLSFMSPPFFDFKRPLLLLLEILPVLANVAAALLFMITLVESKTII